MSQIFERFFILEAKNFSYSQLMQSWHWYVWIYYEKKFYFIFKKNQSLQKNLPSNWVVN